MSNHVASNNRLVFQNSNNNVVNVGITHEQLQKIIDLYEAEIAMLKAKNRELENKVNSQSILN